MRVILALSRHGSYEEAQSRQGAIVSYPLTSEGRAQAKNLARELCRLAALHHLVVHPVIDASPLPRDQETACIAAEVLTAATRKPFRVEQHAVLCERSLRPAADRTPAEMEQTLMQDRLPAGTTELSSISERPFPAAESLVAAGRRVAEHLRKTALALASKSRAETLKLFVGHGGALCYAACELGMVDLASVSTLAIPHGRAVLIERLTTGSWTFLDGAWKDERPGADEASAASVKTSQLDATDRHLA